MSYSKFRKTPETDWFLLTACLSADTDVSRIKSLIDVDYAEPNAFNKYLKETAIISAIKCGNEPVAEELAYRISGLNMADGNGQTALTHAVIAEMDNVAKILIDRGADKEVIDTYEKTAKDYLTNFSTVEIIDLFSDKEEEEPEDEREKLQLFDIEIVQDAIDKENSQKRKHYLKQLLESGSTRILNSLQDTVIDDVNNLMKTFPNFSGVIDFYLRQLALINLDKNKTIRFIPVLLSGPPGIGKTRFSKELSKSLNLEFNLIACSTVTAGFAISGSNTTWESGKPGYVANALRDGVSANPLFQLDEIDKIGDAHKHDPFGPLYTLLENETAKTFTDEALEVPIDVSHVNWIATANNLAVVPEPILSRFVVINVAEPSKDQMLNITQSIYKDVLESFPNWGDAFNQSLSDDIVKEFISLPPRKIRQLVIDACGRSAQRSKDNEEGSLVITNEDIEVAYAKGKASIGFMN